MEVITIEKVENYLDDDLLFKIKKLIVNEGEKIGIIGANGSGKSTLLKMILGEIGDYIGTINNHQKVSMLPQRLNQSNQSGGEQVKQKLMSLLNGSPALLLLDEPSSNLDKRNIDWLIKTLNDYRGTLLIVSHDRFLLDSVVNKIWTFDQKEVKEYVGNFSQYECTKKKERERQEIHYQEYIKKKRSLEKEILTRKEKAQNFKKRKASISVSDYKTNSRQGSYDGQQKAMAKSARAIKKRVDRLTEVEKVNPEKSYNFKAWHSINQKKKTLVNLNANEIKIASNILFTVNEFKIVQGDKIAINGPNKAGKTTFLKQLISKQLDGYLAENINFGYFSQKLDNLDDALSILENVKKDSNYSPDALIDLLSSLGFSYNKHQQSIHHLSGGERVRLHLIKLLMGDYDLLILDEPTNFLDLPTLQSLERFLKEYRGTLLLVSHDHAFIKQIIDKEYLIKDKVLIKQEFTHSLPKNHKSLVKFQLEQMITNPDITIEQIKDFKEKWGI